jgi:hypothetical protein
VTISQSSGSFLRNCKRGVPQAVGTRIESQCGLREKDIVAADLKEFPQDFVANAVAPTDFRGRSRREVSFNTDLEGQ